MSNAALEFLLFAKRIAGFCAVSKASVAKTGELKVTRVAGFTNCRCLVIRTISKAKENKPYQRQRPVDYLRVGSLFLYV